VHTFTEHTRHPGIRHVRIRDLPPTSTALIWLKKGGGVKVRAFAQAATDVVQTKDP